MRPAKIVSGGQTGADRAALDWAIARGIDHGGWCPRGRGARDGPIPARYHLDETGSARPAERTRLNVRDSEGTVVFTSGRSPGSQLAIREALRLGRPCLVLDPLATPNCAVRLEKFCREHRIAVLNVAGDREDEDPGTGRFVRNILELAFG